MVNGEMIFHQKLGNLKSKFFARYNSPLNKKQQPTTAGLKKVGRIAFK